MKKNEQYKKFYLFPHSFKHCLLIYDCLHFKHAGMEVHCTCKLMRNAWCVFCLCIHCPAILFFINWMDKMDFKKIHRKIHVSYQNYMLNTVHSIKGTHCTRTAVNTFGQYCEPYTDQSQLLGPFRQSSERLKKLPLQRRI